MPDATHTRRGERGVILIMVLFIVTLFTVLALEFNYATRVEHHIASTCRDDLLALGIALAGVHETVALLRDDRLRELEEKEREDEEKGRPSETGSSFIEQVTAGRRSPGGVLRDVPFPDHYGEEWARERVQEPFGDGSLTLKVVDESGKFNVNTLVKEQRPMPRAATPTPTPCEDCPPRRRRRSRRRGPGDRRTRTKPARRRRSRRRGRRRRSRCAMLLTRTPRRIS